MVRCSLVYWQLVFDNDMLLICVLVYIYMYIVIHILMKVWCMDMFIHMLLKVDCTCICSHVCCCGYDVCMRACHYGMRVLFDVAVCLAVWRCRDGAFSNLSLHQALWCVRWCCRQRPTHDELVGWTPVGVGLWQARRWERVVSWAHAIRGLCMSGAPYRYLLV